MKAMYFSKERVQTLTQELAKLVVVQDLELKELRCKEGFYLTPAEADAAPAPYRPFDCASGTWDGIDAHYWFTAQITVPDSFAGKPLWISISTQQEGWDATNPQFLFFLNGSATPLQGVDVNHREVLLTRSAEAGAVLRIDLQAYTGRQPGTSVRDAFARELRVSLMERDPEVEALYYNLTVPNDVAGWLPEGDLHRVKLEQALNETVNRIDLREPYSPEFYASVQLANDYIAKAVYTDLAGSDEVIATCIGHTHIDVAWLWTVEQTKEKAARSFATALKLMEEYPDYKFMSSQPQLYAYIKERYPEMFETIKKRVEEGRWEVEGGMWLEADCNLISGESMVRQFLHGKKFFQEEFHRDNAILWLPDVFGYSAALPQIMKKCGIRYFMTTKIAWNQFNKLPMDTFWWKGIDGSEIFTHLITTQNADQPKDSFYTTYVGVLDGVSVIRAWERYQQKALSNDVLLACGYGDGGGGTTRPMAENARRLETGISGAPKARWETARTYFDGLYSRCGEDPRLPRWSGELYLEYHRGTYTSMARNKKGNRKSELLWQDAEFFSTWAAELGKAYPAEEIHKSWETILLNQFHDILPGSSIHDVYEVTKTEYEDLMARAEAIIRADVQLLADSTGAEAGSLVVFNSLSFPRCEVVNVPFEAEALTDGESVYPVQKTPDGAICAVTGIPAKGWKALRPAPAAAADASLSVSERGIETPFYSIAFNDAGFFTSIFDKEAGRQLLKAGKLGNVLRAYEDKPMNYDNWDIDIYYTEKSWLVDQVESMEWVEKGPVRATLRIRRKFLRSTIVQNIRFYAGDRRIDFETWADWKQHQVLLKAEFDVDINANEAAYDIQFGNITRPTHANTSWDAAKFEVCAHKWADLSEGGYGTALLNDCKYGYGIREGHMTLSLIKSGIHPNPVADQEEHAFTYALLPHIGRWQEAAVAEEAYRLNVPVQTAVVTRKGFGLPQSFLTVAGKDSVILETVKQSEDGKATVLRLYEYKNSRVPVTISLAAPFARVEECDLLENPTGELPADNGSFSFEIHPYEIKTFRISRS